MAEVDPNLPLEIAAEKWGPETRTIIWRAEQEFPGLRWSVGLVRPSDPANAGDATYWGQLDDDGETAFAASGAPDYGWALARAMDLAEAAGHHVPIPPAPPPSAPPHGD